MRLGQLPQSKRRRGGSLEDLSPGAISLRQVKPREGGDGRARGWTGRGECGITDRWFVARPRRLARNVSVPGSTAAPAPRVA